MSKIHIHVHDWEESKHPRSKGGQFKAVKEHQARAEYHRQEARMARQLGSHAEARNHEVEAQKQEAAAVRYVEAQEAKKAKKAEKSARNERVKAGTASTVEHLETTGKGELLKIAKAVGLVRADGSTNFSKMSVETLRRQLAGAGYTKKGGVKESDVRHAMGLAPLRDLKTEAKNISESVDWHLTQAYRAGKFAGTFESAEPIIKNILKEKFDIDVSLQEVKGITTRTQIADLVLRKLA